MSDSYTTQCKFIIKASPLNAQRKLSLSGKTPTNVCFRRTYSTLCCITHLCASISFSPIQFVVTPADCPLSILHLLANLVAEDLVPVDLGAGDWELSA